MVKIRNLIIVLVLIISLFISGCGQRTSFSTHDKFICQEACDDEDLYLRHVGREDGKLICNCEKMIII